MQFLLLAIFITAVLLSILRPIRPVKALAFLAVLVVSIILITLAFTGSIYILLYSIGPFAAITLVIPTLICYFNTRKFFSKKAA